MTSNVRNQGIAHLAFRAGAQPFCKSRRAHIVVAAADAAKWGAVCKRCAATLLKMAARTAKASTPKPQIGAERWTAEHISYKRWCDMARARGWTGEDGNDGLREFCEPEEAATVTMHPSLDTAKAWAIETFKTAPDDSAFGAILIEHQTLEAAHDDSGNLVRGCPPSWEADTAYEVTSDGDCRECGL